MYMVYIHSFISYLYCYLNGACGQETIIIWALVYCSLKTQFVSSRLYNRVAVGDTTHPAHKGWMKPYITSSFAGSDSSFMCGQGE